MPALRFVSIKGGMFHLYRGTGPDPTVIGRDTYYSAPAPVPAGSKAASDVVIAKSWFSVGIPSSEKVICCCTAQPCSRTVANGHAGKATRRSVVRLYYRPKILRMTPSFRACWPIAPIWTRFILSRRQGTRTVGTFEGEFCDKSADEVIALMHAAGSKSAARDKAKDFLLKILGRRQEGRGHGCPARIGGGWSLLANRGHGKGRLGRAVREGEGRRQSMVLGAAMIVRILASLHPSRM